jgi:UDP-2,3-diacylglucosamine pyrophosphatase LpxH
MTISKSRKRRCKYGTKKSGSCKKKSGPKSLRSRSRRKSRRRRSKRKSLRKSRRRRSKRKSQRKSRRRRSKRKSHDVVIGHKRRYMTLKRCREELKKKIRINMGEYRSGRYSSRQQALAVSFSQVGRKFPSCKKYLQKRRRKS